MATTRQPKITEAQILTSYLLPPSPLPTILSYGAFLNLIPATYRNDQDLRPHLKRLYRDLQFQRSITIEQVRDNINRECEERAATLRAKLARNIAVDEGVKEAEREEVQIRQRQRRERTRLTRATDDDENDHEEEENSHHEDDIQERQLAAHEALWNDPECLHPAAHVLPLVDGEIQLGDRATYHTRESLLTSLEDTSLSLDHDIKDLEAECARLKDEITETIGALSDLRYGKRQSDGDAQAQFAEVLEAIEVVKNIAHSKMMNPAEL